MKSLDAFADAKRVSLARRRRLRALAPTTRVGPAHLIRNGRRLVEFCGNDYVSLTHHPAVVAAAQEAAARFGTGAGASRLVTGDHPLLGQLEAALAAWLERPAVMLFGSGYLANVGIVPALAGPGDTVVLDARCHACLFAGAQLSRAEVVVTPHADVQAVATALDAATGQALVLTDGIFSMDGDRAPLEALAGLCEARDAWLMVDDAHGLGVLGHGRGSTVGVPVPLLVGTLSKSLASYGGFLAASASVVDLLRSRARTGVYTTGLPPASAAAALAALQVLQAEPERCARPLVLARRFAAALELPEPASPIVPLVVGGEAEALAASARLEAAGFLVTAIRPPTVAVGTSRLRVTFAAGHTDDDVDGLVAAVRRER